MKVPVMLLLALIPLVSTLSTSLPLHDSLIVECTCHSLASSYFVLYLCPVTAEYAPVVTLKPVDVATGEESEEVFYKQRAALYRFDGAANEWKERGRGDVKLLQHNETKKIRVLLRQEKTLKCCMNHIVHPDIDLVANAGSDRSWTWHILDYASDEPEEQTFAIRFKDAESK